MECITPFQVKNKITGETQPVPCGKCPSCKSRRASQWSFRLQQELKQVDSAHFVTLTYEDEHVPKTETDLKTLCKQDLQLFFKRLRKLNKQKLKYYAVGEYGSITYRPHYHIIFFNLNSEHIQKTWNKGEHHIGKVTPASIGYTLKYISKISKVPMFKQDDRSKEFSLMSKKLGLNYLTKQMVNWHKNDLENRTYCNLTDGKKISMPRYYKDKIYTEIERKKIIFTQQQKQLEKDKLILIDKEYYNDKLQSDLQKIRNYNYKNKPKHYAI